MSVLELPTPGADVGKGSSLVRWSGVGRFDPAELQRALADGWAQDGVEGWNLAVDRELGTVLFLPKPNLVVDVGVQRSLDRTFAINGPPAAVDSIGVDNGSSNPTAATTQSGATSKTIRAFDAPATRSGLVVSATGTFTQATVSYAMRRLFLSAGTADAAGSLYAMTNTFQIDLTGFSAWSQSFTAQVTGTGA